MMEINNNKFDYNRIMANISNLNIVIAIIAISVILISIGIVFFIKIVHQRRTIQFSKKIALFRELNEKMTFLDFQDEFEKTYYVNTSAKVASFNYQKKFKQWAYDHKELVEMNVAKANANRKLYETYIGVYKLICAMDSTKYAEQANLSLKTFEKYESKFFEKNLQEPITDICIEIIVSYTSPAGRSHHENSRRFYSKDFIRAIEEVKKEREYRHSKAYQRKALTDSMRYDVMQRDGFRCVLCGRNAGPTVQLHVDHIYPISKGGKTEMSNLRTLCAQCNLGKRDKYDPQKMN